jgi:uncharacterized protein (DUF924 family)
VGWSMAETACRHPGMTEIDDLLSFWFSPRVKEMCWKSTPAFDAESKAAFSETYRRGAAGKLDGWTETARGALALTIVLDQLPRNFFRGEAKAFATDKAARAVTELALKRGYDRAITDPDERTFLYMPFMHSEALADQDRCVALVEAGGCPEKTVESALGHRAVIERFGRFPRRNAALGRRNTPEEDAYLNDGEIAGRAY